MGFVRLTLLVGAMIPSGLWAQVEPSLLISFDQDFNAQGRSGVVSATVTGKPELAPGKVGRALKSGPAFGYLDFPTAGQISPRGGTVEMWVCPLDWEPGAEEFHVFFDVRGEGALYLYKYYQGVNLLMLTCENTTGPYTSSAFAIGGWKPGQWHHIAGTWSPDGVTSYVDGKPASRVPAGGPLPKSLGTTFRIGDDPWHIPRQTASLVDEVRVYDRPLSAAHIAAHATGNYAFTAPLSADLARLTFDVDPTKAQALVRVSTGGADVDEARLRVRLALGRPGAPVPAEARELRFDQGLATGAVPLVSSEPGTYEVMAEVQLDGKAAFVLRRELVIPDLAWKDSRLGTEDQVLPPWTALETAGTTVKCWGREYRFGEAALPAQIVSAGAEILARPVSLALVDAAGMPAPVVRQSLRVVSSSDMRAELQGEVVVGLGGREFGFATRVVAEYDGVLVIELRRSGAEALPTAALHLDLPVKARHALYRHRWAPRWDGYAGFVPAGDGVVDADKFIPYAWLGDNDRGLFWFCESDEPWPNSDSTNAFETVRTGDEICLRLNLVAAGQALPANWCFRFGLQATPVKPLPRDWRKWRLQPGRNANVSILWPTPQPDSLRYYGYPEATDPDLMAKRIAVLHEKSVSVVPYLCLSFLSAACPEWPYLGRSWSMGAADTGSSDVAAYGAAFAMVSPVAEGYADFIVWKTKQFIDRYGVDGLYHDNTHPYGSSVFEAGCGYLRDGKRRSTYPILGYRELYRRMYAVAKASPKPTFTMAHMSGKVTIPILAYDDSYLDGEHFRGRVKDSYLDLLSLDAFRAEFMGRQWGIMPYFIPEFDQQHAKQIEPTRGLMALLMLHDVSPWPIWCNVEAMNQALAALDEFGYVESEFLPYFDPAPPAQSELPDVHVSGYRRGDGRVLLVVANLGRVDRAGDVRLDRQRLGLPSLRCLSWPEKQPLPLTDDRLALDIPKLGYRLVLAEPQG